MNNNCLIEKYLRFKSQVQGEDVRGKVQSRQNLKHVFSHRGYITICKL